MRFREGDIVRIAKSSAYYKDGYYNNPKDTNGVVIQTDNPTELNYRVRWDSGSRNSYGEEDLKLVRRGDGR